MTSFANRSPSILYNVLGHGVSETCISADGCWYSGSHNILTSAFDCYSIFPIISYLLNTRYQYLEYEDDDYWERV